MRITLLIVTLLLSQLTGCKMRSSALSEGEEECDVDPATVEQEINQIKSKNNTLAKQNLINAMTNEWRSANPASQRILNDLTPYFNGNTDFPKAIVTNYCESRAKMAVEKKCNENASLNCPRTMFRYVDTTHAIFKQLVVKEANDCSSRLAGVYQLAVNERDAQIGPQIAQLQARLEQCKQSMAANAPLDLNKLNQDETYFGDICSKAGGQFTGGREPGSFSCTCSESRVLNPQQLFDAKGSCFPSVQELSVESTFVATCKAAGGNFDVSVAPYSCTCSEGNVSMKAEQLSQGKKCEVKAGGDIEREPQTPGTSVPAAGKPVSTPVASPAAPNCECKMVQDKWGNRSCVKFVDGKQEGNGLGFAPGEYCDQSRARSLSGGVGFENNNLCNQPVLRCPSWK